MADGASSWLDDHGRDLDHALGGALHDGALDGDPGALDHALHALRPAFDGRLDGRHAGKRLDAGVIELVVEVVREEAAWLGLGLGLGLGFGLG